jgi:hypothetical protein
MVVVPSFAVMYPVCVDDSCVYRRSFWLQCSVLFGADALYSLWLGWICFSLHEVASGNGLSSGYSCRYSCRLYVLQSCRLYVLLHLVSFLGLNDVLVGTISKLAVIALRVPFGMWQLQSTFLQTAAVMCMCQLCLLACGQLQ